MDFRITINKQEFIAKLADSKTVRQLAEQLPAEMEFERGGNHEFYCRLGKSLDAAGQSGTSDIHENGIYYFDSWKALSFVYKDMDIFPYKVLWLGDFTDNVSEDLEIAAVRISVRMETM